jgi:hypothetical protein
MNRRIVPLAALAAAALAGAASAAAPSVTLKASSTQVVYAGATTLSGVLSTQKAGQKITIEAQECGKTKFGPAGAPKTTSGGAFTFAAKPTINTTYRAKYKNATSPPVAVSVKPSLRLNKLSRSRYRVALTAGLSFAGKYVNFQRYNASMRKWKTVTRITFATAQASGPAPTTVSLGTKRIALRTRARVRAMLPQAQAGCYLTTTSNSVRG